MKDELREAATRATADHMNKNGPIASLSLADTVIAAVVEAAAHTAPHWKEPIND
jgi:hypothetical protein